MEQAISKFCDYLTINKGYSPLTVTAYSHDLRQFQRYLKKIDRPSDFRQITDQDITGFLTSLGKETRSNSAVTRARKLASIRSFFKYLLRSRLLDVNPSQFVELPVIPQREPEYLTIKEYQKLIKTVVETSTPFFQARDIAIITLFLTTGIRVSELVGLRISDISMEASTIRILRKRNKSQTIPVAIATMELIAKYISLPRPIDTEYVFLGKRNNRLTSNGVYSLVRKYLHLAGIQKERKGPHTLRHTCFTTLVLNEVNPVVIQALAGHSSFDTTRRYLHINNKQIQNAVETIQLQGVL